MAVSDNTNSRSDIKRGTSRQSQTAKTGTVNMPYKPPRDDSARKADVKHETKLREKVQDLKEKLHPPRPKRSEPNTVNTSFAARKGSSTSHYGARTSCQQDSSFQEPINLTMMAPPSQAPHAA